MLAYQRVAPAHTCALALTGLSLPCVLQSERPLVFPSDALHVVLHTAEPSWLPGETPALPTLSPGCTSLAPFIVFWNGLLGRHF